MRRCFQSSRDAVQITINEIVQGHKSCQPQDVIVPCWQIWRVLLEEWGRRVLQEVGRSRKCAKVFPAGPELTALSMNDQNPRWCRCIGVAPRKEVRSALRTPPSRTKLPVWDVAHLPLVLVKKSWSSSVRHCIRQSVGNYLAYVQCQCTSFASGLQHRAINLH